tara:strand:- start:15 stop:539 length:525 start_codon:yes stop_codon:yes gene_type:complete
MGSEFFINSQELENKMRQLLPSQGGAGAGFDLSASTQIIPVIDLTESASGSLLRQDLQTSLSFSSVTAFSVSNATTTIINNTGYYRVFGQNSITAASSLSKISFILNDGVSDKVLMAVSTNNVTIGQYATNTFDFIVFLSAGNSLKITCANTDSTCTGNTRQIADIDGVLVNPN